MAAAGAERAIVTAPGPFHASPLLLEEAGRLARSVDFVFASEVEALGTQPDEAAGAVVVIGGAELVEGHWPAAPCCGRLDAAMLTRLRSANDTAALMRAERRIIAATTKPGDGIVSRHLNRPISQAITRVLLRIPGLRPAHATVGTGLIAVAMMAALVQGTPQGLVAGALLFQGASIFDGVDGEISRATFRSSAGGARADSLVDAATNLACIGGVAYNLLRQGQTHAALAGLAGLALLFAGLAVIGLRSRGRGGEMTFNAVKDHFSAGKSKVMTVLTWLTMRDFFALAGAVLIVSGFAAHALYIFAVVAAGWLAVVLAVMGRQAA